MSNTLTNKEKKKIINKTYNALVLSLRDGILREVSKESTVACLWIKLKKRYMTKSLANRLYKKIRLYTFILKEGGSVREHLDEFNRIILDIENINIKIKDKDKVMLLFSSLLNSYEYFVDTLTLGR